MRLVACSTVLVVIGAFIALFGLRAFRAARFPLLFLAFMVPLPTAVEEWIIRVLQLGSAEFVAFLFPLTGMPVLRDACVFHLPGISIEVAPQCSGIRSSLALVITCVLAGHMFLKTGLEEGRAGAGGVTHHHAQERDPDRNPFRACRVRGQGIPGKLPAQGRGDCLFCARFAADGSDPFCAQEERAQKSDR